MRQLTLRGFDDELERRLRRLAQERGLSLNRAALAMMRRGAGLEVESPTAERGGGAIGAALDKFFGVWSESDEREFSSSVEGLDRIDEGLWR